MSYKIKLNYKSQSKFVTLEEIFGRDLHIGDYVLFSVAFWYIFNHIVPVFVITEEGLCWHDGSIVSYDINVLSDQDYFHVYKLNPGKDELELINNLVTTLATSNNFFSKYKATDIWQRKLHAGDLLLCYIDEHIEYSIYAICVADREAFDGHYKIDLHESYYIIANPTSDEAIIKKELCINYNRYMQEK